MYQTKYILYIKKKANRLEIAKKKEELSDVSSQLKFFFFPQNLNFTRGGKIKSNSSHSFNLFKFRQVLIHPLLVQSILTQSISTHQKLN